ncbi:disease resistance protein RGA2-like [Rhodamnia argentea]|uniref:Disease resistance protein RGA2-like n=1 Tax=Rhodamnia argentea TaxID=178133 RepID=A0ABM3H4A7_9MYRT|nr:disease resistance protein RGA2-like [Rhodamnia argentea]
MAESLLFSIAQGVLGKIASPAFQEAVAIYSVEDQIHEFKDTMDAITAVLLDAEEQQAKNHRLQLWLRRLRDVLYDAEDVLDELECEALRKRVLNRYGGVKEKFDLNVRSVDNGVVHLRSREMTYSFVNKLDVVGRESDKDKIIKILMQPDRKNLSVIPIVGIGGMGKTALAKLIYNDDNVKKQFESRLWVCVPEDFDLKKTIEGIIKDATGQSLSNLDIQQLQTSLRYIIRDKKFLLVLDDVWSSDRSRWEELKALLTEGASGSKIIVTTCSSEVASIMGNHPAHNLKGLSHEDSMALFKKWAFDQKEKHPRPDLLEMGDDIVKKCQGVPLLVKTLGSLLFTKDEVRGFEFHSVRLDDLWMALGLVSSTTENEDFGVEYVKELWKRSLIQEVDESESILTFKVHDLVHSLATIVARNDCSVVGLDTEEISEGTRYISFPSNSSEGITNFDEVPPFLRKPTSKRLRAIILPLHVNDRVITREFARTCISKCNHLRYLDLMDGTFEELPSSIRNLKQLRSLNLSGNKRLKKLPDTICELQSLLYLYLEGCLELGELPKNMDRLVNLRFLFVTTKQTLNIDDCKLVLTEENKSNFPLNLRTLSISRFEQVMELLQCLDKSTCTMETFAVYDCPSFTVDVQFGQFCAV